MHRILSDTLKFIFESWRLSLFEKNHIILSNDTQTRPDLYPPYLTVLNRLQVQCNSLPVSWAVTFFPQSRQLETTMYLYGKEVCVHVKIIVKTENFENKYKI